MSTTITSENDVEIRVGKLGVGVVHPEGVASIWARLTPEQRSALADALDPGRPGWTLADLAQLRTTLANSKAGGQWTRDDLPGPMWITQVVAKAVAAGSQEMPSAAVLDAVVDHLNAHHPKPSRGVETGYALQVDALTRERDALDSRLTRVDMECAEAVTARVAAERTCDELRSLIERQKELVSKLIEVRNRMRRERDEALRKKGEMVDRAVRAERELGELRSKVNAWGREHSAPAVTQNPLERERDAAVARAEAAEKRLRQLEARPWTIALDDKASPVFMPAVTRDEIATVLERTDSDTSHGDEVTYTDMADAVLALVSGTDPAVFVVRESDLPTDVNRSDDGRWFVGDEYAGHENSFPEAKRSQRNVALAMAAKHEAVARAIEAEQAVDPAEELTDNLADILYGDELVTDQMRGVLERVVRAGMLLPEQEASSDE